MKPDYRRRAQMRDAGRLYVYNSRVQGLCSSEAGRAGRVPIKTCD